jgi:hypothetical protein
MDMKASESTYDSLIELIAFKKLATGLCSLFILLSPGFVHGQNQQQATGTSFYLVEDFEDDSIGALPKKWYNQKGEAKPHTYTGSDRDLYDYSIREESGNKFLRYEGNNAKHLNYPLLNKEVNIYETPILSWKWRVFELPEGANEDVKEKDDAAAGIYVAFDMGRVALFKKVPKSIKYSWSSTLEKGTELSKFYGNQKLVVVESGEDETGKWIRFERNLLEDYKRLFGDDPPETPLAILILSDANSTGSSAKADYDDIKLLSASSSDN